MKLLNDDVVVQKRTWDLKTLRSILNCIDTDRILGHFYAEVDDGLMQLVAFYPGSGLVPATHVVLMEFGHGVTDDVMIAYHRLADDLNRLLGKPVNTKLLPSDLLNPDLWLVAGHEENDDTIRIFLFDEVDISKREALFTECLSMSSDGAEVYVDVHVNLLTRCKD
jgi:hypothetical protein